MMFTNTGKATDECYIKFHSEYMIIIISISKWVANTKGQKPVQGGPQ